jgi:osmotically-inducible protein OsmY
MLTDRALRNIRTPAGAAARGFEIKQFVECRPASWQAIVRRAGNKSRTVRRFPRGLPATRASSRVGNDFQGVRSTARGLPAIIGRISDCKWSDRQRVVGGLEEGTVTTASLTDADVRVRDSVMRQLEWDPAVDASAIGVAAKAGTITLTGYIDSYSGKLAAERAAKRVHGVRAVANDIDVRLRLERTDADIAQDAVRALDLRSTVPQSVQVALHEGYVTLTGKVDWVFQKQDAEKAVRHIRGVRGVLNHIAVAPQAEVRDVQRRIVKALHRNADVDARHISVTVSGETAILTGTVGTFLQRESAERAAASAPGIAYVDDRIAVEPPIDAGLDAFDEIC